MTTITYGQWENTDERENERDREKERFQGLEANGWLGKGDLERCCWAVPGERVRTMALDVPDRWEREQRDLTT